MKKKSFLFVFAFQGLAVLAAAGVMVGLLSIGMFEQRSAAASIILNRGNMSDKEKFAQTKHEIERQYRRMIVPDPGVYLKNPEAEFIKSIRSYFFSAATDVSREIRLDDAMVRSYGEQGIILYSMDRHHPLMKNSIYVDSTRRAVNIPRINRGDNVIIIFVESLSSFFLQEEIHGRKGLFENIKDMQSQSYSFTGMTNAAFPTIKGLIASLGSSLYLLEENVGGTRIPIPCRFLFLSNILKPLGYTNMHVQGGSERFIGMKDFFIEREGYDRFYGSESIAIDSIRNMKGGFGVDDETMFKYTVELLEKHDGSKPFLLTISTIDSHPPFKTRYRHAAAGDNRMLNSFYSTDRAFGIFWEYFKQSRYRGNTVVILMADHAMGNNREYNEFAIKYGDHYRPFIDNIPCFMYFPRTDYWKGKSNPTSCTNLDFLPTVLDMMNIDLENPFIGVSIFAERNHFNKALALQVGDFSDPMVRMRVMKINALYRQLYKSDAILPKEYRVRFR